MNVKEIEKLTRRELRARADEAFKKADEKGPSYLLEAQFYIGELERRADSRTSIRDFILEIVVIGLIAGEILLGYRQGRDEAKASALEHEVLTNLQTSSAATAGTLTALQETSKQMNEAIQKELAVSYEVSLNVKYDITSDRIIITNEGRTGVALWGSKVGKSGIVMEKGPRMLTPGVPYSIAGQEVAAGLGGIGQVGVQKPPVPFVMFVKNERGEEFVARYEFVGLIMVGPLQIQPIMVSITPFEWSKKH